MEHLTGNVNLTVRQQQFKHDVDQGFKPIMQDKSNTVTLHGQNYPVAMVQRLGMMGVVKVAR